MLFERLWRDVTAFLAWICLTPASQDNFGQVALGADRHHATDVSGLALPGETTTSGDNYGSPIFYPPGGNGEFRCDYSAMGKDWHLCSVAENRECWIRNVKTGEEYNIHTNYEKVVPVGRLREYTLDVTDSWYAADGLNFTAAKLFNDVYPGPWLQACWGDTVRVTVTNKMRFNGTSIHWHGIRQLGSMDMDGVNGVTQCPIAPGHQMTYTFNTTQYGSSWYHSHYSVQYADGLQGPITIHGPSSSSYDHPVEPLIMTDWYHLSAFHVLNNSYPAADPNKTILLNGRGDARNFNYTNTTAIKPHHEIVFEPRQHNTTNRAKRYLLRLINTSFDSTFVVSIDNHWMQVVGADFVPIEPYWNTSVLVGIGQRYHVIVEADPDFSFNNGTDDNRMPGENDGNYWIRTWVADCRLDDLDDLKPGYEQVGVLRYDASSTALPHSKPWPEQFVSRKCSDETYSSLVPKIPWYIGPAANNKLGKAGQQYNVTLYRDRPQVPRPYPLATFSLEPADGTQLTWTPLRVNYSDPTITHLHQPGYDYPPEYVVLNEDYQEDDWVYLVLSGNRKHTSYGAHPIHLHGHDFAILQQTEGAMFSLDNFKPKFDNPPRRDVVLLPVNGFVVIAFRPDNPGNWLLHCHIAEHASFGLGYQILERRGNADHLYPVGGAAQSQIDEVCAAWDKWQSDCKNWYPQDIDTKGKYPACEDPLKYKSQYFTFGQDSGI